MDSETQDPGLGAKYNRKVKRLLNPDGSYNVKRKGGLTTFRDTYKFLIEVSTPKLIGILLATYILLNILFASLYFFIGEYQIEGIQNSTTPFIDCLYFSFQTFTTVGYGAYHPSSHIVHIISSFEAFVGFLSFSIATGIIYGRFSKPKVKIKFSNNIIFTPFKGTNALMFKMVNKRNNVLLDTKVDVILILDTDPLKQDFNKQYFNLKLELDKIQFFPLTWTVVHSIDEDSPIANLTYEEFMNKNPEIIVLAKAFDETFSQEIFEKHSYSEEQWRNEVKFTRNFSVNHKGEIILRVDEINNIESIEKTL